MNTTTVYRLMHPVTKTGPWRSQHTDEFKQLTPEQRLHIQKASMLLNNYWESNGTYNYRHPSALFDFMAWRVEYVCAAPDLASLRGWFALCDDIIDALCDAGFTVIAYTVDADKVMQSHSETQVGFSHAHVIEEHDMTILALIED